MLQVQDIYRRDFSSIFRSNFIKDRALCDRIKNEYGKISESQLKYKLLEWGREFKNIYIDTPDSHKFDLPKEAENFVKSKLVIKKLLNK